MFFPYLVVRRHRKYYLKLISILVPAICAIIAISYPVALRCHVLSAQRWCELYSESPNSLICEARTDFDSNKIVAHIDSPKAWLVLQQSVLMTAHPPIRPNLHNPSPEPIVEAPVFMHLLTRPDSTKRLVIVRFCDGNTYGKSDREFSAMIIEPGTLFRPPHLIKEESCTIASSLEWDAAFRIFGGCIDSHDPTTFSIRYEKNRVLFAIHGELQDDDSVTWSSGAIQHD